MLSGHTLSGSAISAVPVLVPASPGPPAPDLSWGPHYPDRIPPHVRLHASLQQFYRSTINPIINPPPPTELTWLGTYPSHVIRHVLPAAAYAVIVAPVPSNLLQRPTSWQGSYPAIISPRRGLAPQHQLVSPFQSSSILSIPVQQGWRPTYPSQIARVQPTRTGQQWWLVDPGTLINATGCIVWTNETLLQPSLDGEAVVSPAMSEETVTVPELTAEDLC